MNYSFLPFSPLAAKPIMTKFWSQQYQWQSWSNFTHNSRSSRLVEMKIESGLWCWYSLQRITNTGNFASNWKSQEKNLNVSNKNPSTYSFVYYNTTCTVWGSDSISFTACLFHSHCCKTACSCDREKRESDWGVWKGAEDQCDMINETNAILVSYCLFKFCMAFPK